jgi:hypothetical protein
MDGIPDRIPDRIRQLMVDIRETDKELEALSKIELIDGSAIESLDRLLVSWQRLRMNEINHMTLGSLRQSGQDILERLRTLHSREVAFWRLFIGSIRKLNSTLDLLRKDNAWKEIRNAELLRGINSLILAAEKARNNEIIALGHLRSIGSAESIILKETEAILGIISKSGSYDRHADGLKIRIDALCHPLKGSLADGKSLTFGQVVHELKSLRSELMSLLAECVRIHERMTKPSDTPLRSASPAP